MSNNVHVWEENVTIPTYKVYPPEKGPLFIENRAYQGSSGKVYPLPVTEKISDKKEDVNYHAIYLENDYLKVMVLPELGGRIQRAYDKTNGYDFVYYNHVIKPALVGLTGPWISGGIEFNWPQHHRPSTYSPVDYYYQEREDGSATVYVSEIDKMYGTKGMGAFTLYPDKAYIEIKGQLFNNTDIPQTFLWWANPAVPVNDNTYSVFPPDVHAVMDHGKRAVSTFPIATGEYYKYDYSAGVDISMYKNIKVPTSYMAAHSDFDFIGNYDEGRKAGLLHVADHHISPGKKQWTWGNADFGRAWDRNLTDEDGPYIELMTGVFADNQPDFTWLKPYEEKTFTQYFMPYKNVGRVKNATKDAMVNFTIEDSTATLLLYTSGSYNGLTLSVEKEGTVLYSKTIDISPLQAFEDTFTTDTSSTAGCTVKVTATDGHTLVTYTGLEEKLEPIPDPAVPLGTPEDIYNEPQNAFVADFIGDSNILPATMVEDKVVKMLGAVWKCVDVGFGRNKPVDAVIRPEDIDLVKPGEGVIDGVVTNLIFKGVHYEMEVLANNYELLVHSTDLFPVGTEVGIQVDPFDIQIMKKPESEDEEAPALEA